MAKNVYGIRVLMMVDEDDPNAVAARVVHALEAGGLEPAQIAVSRFANRTQMDEFMPLAQKEKPRD